MEATVKKSLAPIACVLLLAACNSGSNSPNDGIAIVPSGLDKDIERAVSGCAAGLSRSVSLELEAALKSKGGELTTSVKQEALGIIFSDDSMTEENRTNAYKYFIECYNKERERYET